MKNLIKIIAVTIVLLINGISLYGQNADQVVTLTTTGEGKTKQEAISVALRNAIEQAFGTFISSKTEILNDNLIKDEIVSVSNGNIQKYDIITEGQLDNGNYYSTIKAMVSVSKLTTFCESKGINVEFKGSLFAFNIKQQELNEKNEVKAVENMRQIVIEYIIKSLDYKIETSQPIAVSDKRWKIPIKIGVAVNANFFQIPQILDKTLSGLSMNEEEAMNYRSLNKPVFVVLMMTPENINGKYYILRDGLSVIIIESLLFTFNQVVSNAKIANGLSESKISELSENDLLLADEKFRLFLQSYGDNVPHVKGKGSVFFPSCDYGKLDILTDYNLDLKKLTDYNLDELTAYNKEYYFKEYHFKPIFDIKSLINSISTFLVLRYDDEFFQMVKKTGLPPTDGYYLISLVLSFINIKSSDYSLITIFLNDYRTIDEIEKITEYKIIPFSK